MRSAGRARAAALAASAAGLAAAASCSDDRAPPARLVDGTPARIARIGFENVTVPVIATVRRERLDTALPGCASRMVARRVVERIGVAGASITLVADDVIRACDAIRRGTWCGHAFAWTSTPFDPRLSVTCSDPDGRPVGFAWVMPGRSSAYVVVHHDGYAEAYRVTRREPTRVTTSEVDESMSSAGLEVSEHTGDGRLLRKRSITAQVSG